MNRKQVLFGVVGIAIVAVLVLAYFVFVGGRTAETADSDGRGNVSVASRDRTLGSPKAPIVMVEYAAPTCPHCARFNETVFPQLKSVYIDTGKVYYVFRVFPLNSVDVAAENMARCLPANNYFQFIDLLFRNQPKWDPEYQIPDVHAALVQMGRIAGMSAEQVDRCINDQAGAQQITKVGEDAATRYGVNSTPTFVVNGKVLHFGTWQEVKDTLDPMLKKSS